jgi:hypothetical protein
MADDASSAVQARRRADEAGERARQLRAHVDAVRAGIESLHGTTRAELELAIERAGRASERLIQALLASADAHDRAAEAYDAHIRRHGDPDGARASRAAVHRQDAIQDRDLAADVKKR